MYEKKALNFPQSFYIFRNRPSVYITGGPAKLVKFDKGFSPDTCLRNLKKLCTYFIYVVGYESLPQ